MSSFDRGFKSWAEHTSLTLRRELGLAQDDPLDASELARCLDVDLWTPYDVPSLPKDVLNQLLEQDPCGWSAVSLVSDSRGLVIYNPRKSKGRRASDITHELAHFILDHEPSTMILSHDGGIAMRTFDRKQEDEANWLAWCLLLPREALVWAKRARLSTAGIAARFGVAEVLVTFRLKVTGVEFQLGRRSLRRA